MRSKKGYVAAAVLAIAAVTTLGLSPAESQTVTEVVEEVSGDAFGGYRISESDLIDLDSLDIPDLQNLVEAAQAGDSEQVASILADAGLGSSELSALAEGGEATPQAIISESGPAPTVTLPPEGGGPFVEELDELRNDFDQLLATNLRVTTEGALGASGFAESTAHAEDVNRGECNNNSVSAAGFLGCAPLAWYTADAVDTECRTDLAETTASTTITNGELNEFAILLGATDPAMPENPDPNTEVGNGLDITIPIGPVAIQLEGFLILNEQTGGTDDITVTGTHGLFAIRLLIPDNGTTEVINLLSIEAQWAQSHCDLVRGEEVEAAPADQGPIAAQPAFTG